MAQVKSITSDSLESAYRGLTPSQSGFTEDLQASNVILPIIDLTASAEGSSVRQDLQTAWDITTTNVTIGTGTPTDIVTNTGFWYLYINATGDAGGASQQPVNTVELFDGVTQYPIWKQMMGSTVVGNHQQVWAQLTIFVNAGESIRGFAGVSGSVMNVSARQIADINGTLQNPRGFTPQ